MSNVRELRNTLEGYKGRLHQIHADISQLKASVGRLNTQIERSEQALAIVQEVGRKTQEQLQYHISGLVSLALAAVFDDPYEFKIEFVIRRGKTECDLMFVRNGEAFHPMSASGGGAVDVAAFALRVALWSLARPRARNVVVLDEPLKFVSEDYLPRASALMKEVSDDLGLQILMVTHSEELVEAADRVLRISKRKGVSVLLAAESA